MIHACQPEPMMISTGIEPGENPGRPEIIGPLNTRRSLALRVDRLEEIVAELNGFHWAGNDYEAMKHLENLSKLVP